MAKQWGCAVVGTGTVGEWHARTLPRLPNARLVPVCDRAPAKPRAPLAKHDLTGSPAYTSLDDLLRKHAGEIGAVHICTPSGDHEGPAILAMQAGKNVISEKPLEIQLDRIDRMIEAAG